MFIFLSLLFFLSSCVQEGAKIIYRNENSSNNEKNITKPEYIKGSYIKTKNEKIVRDLRKNNEYINENKRIKIENGNRIIIVENGDSLLKIARECDCSLNEIAELNKIKSPYNVYPKQKILVNCGKYKKIKHNINGEIENYKIITVEKGLSLIKIASSNGSTVSELARINSIEPPYNLYIGQKIKVPVRGNEMQNSSLYIVKKGDNLYSIARENNINFTDLISYNNLKKPYNINVGQKLYLQKSSEKGRSKNNKHKNELERVEGEDSKILQQESQINLAHKDKNDKLFLWPVKGEIIKNFGKQENGGFNDAINIKANFGTEIKAAETGEVAYAGNELKGFGNIIIIKHKNGWLTIYGHCDSILVKVKDKIQIGQSIGTVGKTGNVDEPQLYFSLRKGRTAIDPIKYLTN